MLFTVTSGLLDACVLSALRGGDSYGYELTTSIKSMVDISESTLYPVLKRLQRENLLTTYDEAVSGRNRRYYSITETGLGRMNEYINEWEAYKTRIDRILLTHSNAVIPMRGGVVND